MNDWRIGALIVVSTQKGYGHISSMLIISFISFVKI